MFINSQIAEVLITHQQISRRVKALGAKISKDYKDKNPLVVCVLKGSWIFVADLVRALDLDVDVDFIAASSYGGGTESSGNVILTKDLTTPCKGRHILLVEDIVDSGVTLSRLKALFADRDVASCEIITLLDKPSRRKVHIDVKYVGFTIPNEFIVGYGMDYDEKFRTLKDICILQPEVFS